MWIVSLLLALVLWCGGSLAAAGQPSAANPLEIEGEPVTALGVEPVSGTAAFAATDGATWRASEQGDWQRAGASPGHEVLVVDSRDSLQLWAGSPVDCYRGMEEPRPMVRSVDGGGTWEPAGPDGAVPLASWMNTGIAIAHDCSGLLVSTDAGSTWVVPDGYPLGSQVTAFTVASTPESAAGLVLLVGATGEGGTTQLYRVQVSGFEPPVVDGPLASWFGLGSLAVLDDGAWLIGAPQGVMRSDDHGATWSNFRGGLESTTLEADPLETFPEDLEPGSFGLRAMLDIDGDTWVSGVDGLYRWSDAAFTWEQVVPLDREVERMAVSVDRATLYAETVDGEVLQVPLE